MNKLMCLALTACLGQMLSGCAFIRGASSSAWFHVSVSGLSETDIGNGKTYFLASALKNTPETDLQFKEYAKYVERALAAKGYVRTSEAAKADLLVFLAYGIGDPQTVQYSYAVPTWGQTGISSSYSYGGTTVFTPSFGVNGYLPMTHSQTFFFRYARLDCYDYAAFRKDKQEHPLWRTDIKSTGSSGDLRHVFPVMIAAAKSQFGVNTGVEVGFDIDSDDPAVIEIKGLQSTSH